MFWKKGRKDKPESAPGSGTALEGLKESGERCRRVFDTSRDGLLLIHKTEGSILNSNESAQTLLGYSKEELLNKKLWGIGIVKDYEDFQEVLQRLENDGVVHFGDTPVKNKEGLSLDSEVFLVDQAKVVQCNIRDITERKALEYVSATQLRIANVFLTISEEEEMFNDVLKIILEVMKSPFGVLGYLDEAGAFVVPAMTRQVLDKCQVPDKTIIFPKETWGNSTWSRVILEKRADLSNEPSTNILKGHVSILRHIDVPVLFQGEAIGLFEVANRETDYTVADLHVLESITSHVAAIMNAILYRMRAEEEAGKRLHELENFYKACIGREERILELKKEIEKLKGAK